VALCSLIECTNIRRNLLPSSSEEKKQRYIYRQKRTETFSPVVQYHFLLLVRLPFFRAAFFFTLKMEVETCLSYHTALLPWRQRSWRKPCEKLNTHIPYNRSPANGPTIEHAMELRRKSSSKQFQLDSQVTEFILSDNCSTCFGCHYHSFSGAQNKCNHSIW